jgi:hypothetical protein
MKTIKSCKNADPCNLNFNRIECGPNQHPLQDYHEPVQQLKDLTQHCRIIVSLNDVPYDFDQGPRDFPIKSKDTNLFQYIDVVITLSPH